ncbi:MAG: hypothetical protein E6Q68_06775 [Polynucleobacter sp.]|nr:MAG: hypothetical protein E6Q68_06775 [Polynucleobacter sp.]
MITLITIAIVVVVVVVVMASMAPKVSIPEAYGSDPILYTGYVAHSVPTDVVETDAEEPSREEEIDLELYLATPVGNKGLKTHLCEGRIYRKERNSKAKNSKKKGQFKPWQVR